MNNLLKDMQSVYDRVDILVDKATANWNNVCLLQDMRSIYKRVEELQAENESRKIENKSIDNALIQNIADYKKLQGQRDELIKACQRARQGLCEQAVKAGVCEIIDKAIANC